MSQRYRKFKRSWGTYYAYDSVTGNSVSLKTRVRTEADQKVHAMNEADRQPAITLGLARVYLNAADPKLGTRTWQEVMGQRLRQEREPPHWIKHRLGDGDAGCDGWILGVHGPRFANLRASDGP